LFSMT